MPSVWQSICLAAILSLTMVSGAAASEPGAWSWRTFPSNTLYKKPPAADSQPWLRDGDTRMLVYTDGAGVEEVWLGCRDGDGAITFGFLVHTRPPADFMIDNWSNKHPMRDPLPITVSVSSGVHATTARDAPMHHQLGAAFNAKFRLNHPVVRAFARSGSIRLGALGETRAPPPAPRADVERLVRACAGRS